MDKQKQLDSGVPDVKEKMIYVSALEACQLMQSDMRGFIQPAGTGTLRKVWTK